MAIAVGSMIIYSCQKEQKDIGKSVVQTEQKLKDVKVEQRILAFKEKMDLTRKNPALKSASESMEIDSAIWYIEAASNLTYGNASAPVDEYIVDSSFFDVSLTDGKVPFTEIQTIYDKVVDSLSLHYARILLDEKRLLVVDVSLKESDGEIARFQLKSGFTVNNSKAIIGDKSSWYWGYDMGRCDVPGLGVGKDAADIIMYKANREIAVPFGNNSYYTDVEIESLYSDQYPTDDGRRVPFYEYHAYTLVHPCFSAEDINFYKKEYIKIAKAEKPSGKSLISFYIFDGAGYGLTHDNYDCWHLGHFANITYGIWHTSSTPPVDLK